MPATPDRNQIFDALAAAACVLALTVAVQTVSGLRWPYDGDHYRDVAQAQTARDGHPLSDPFYPDEWVWYNPLVPWIVAAGSAITRITPAAFDVQAGPWLNLLAPIAFYLLCARLAGRGAAFAALIIFLFFNCRTDPALTCPTYSSWLFVATFAQGLFFLTLLAMAWTVPQQTAVRAGLVGALAGLTFLAHTGPALVLGATAILLLRLRSIIIAGLVALIVASPFLYAIEGHYHLHVVNPVPMAWQWLPVTIEGFPGTLRANAVLILAGLAGGFVVRSKVARVWLIVSLLLTALSLTRELTPSVPPIVPTFHFWRYAMAALTIMAGGTVWKLCELVARKHAVATLAVVATVAVAIYLPQYRSRFDFVYGQSIARNRDPNHAATTAWLRQQTPESAVILGTRGASLQIIGPAGRRVVAVNANWSNPYVDVIRRVDDREAMLEALKAGDDERFTPLADAYRVTHVVGVGPEECGQIRGSRVKLMDRIGDLCVFSRNH